MTETKTSALKVNIELVPQPEVESWMMFTDSSALIEAIQQGETPSVSVSLKTKTRVTLSLRGGGGAWNLNMASDKFKTFEKKTYSYLTYKDVTSNYFTLSKKQNYDALLEYIKECVSKALGNVVDAEELTIHLQNSRDLRYIKAKFC
jgi:hypothetical protein